ncbi:putative zinc-binding metallopeptidase [Caballeronia sp. LZ033]|uniref:zinc-binding metallopeptidase family protein n=1 Tax=Caballeronia sp. LZ033 TaxID=3038566 RepID=UPI0028670DEC|nr:putative zinc-binding metallopeptidase [Caballeronia sp. LZ033]MDR5818680.1 putative zinc-binding metallopeptidase [Caballeronia sp. LZ033]
MRIFHCTACAHPIFFEHVQCERCGSALGFISETGEMSAFTDEGTNRWKAHNSADDKFYRPCHNYAIEHVCNWMVPSASDDRYCESCRLTSIIPNLRAPRRKHYWSRLEAAKRRLLYTLSVLQLRVETRQQNPATGLQFEFRESRANTIVTTGHKDGLITMNIAEADDLRRERVRIALGEPYRTLLGHFRHEIGHYYFDRLVAGTEHLRSFRTLFGDERKDYGDALDFHYHNGAPADWGKAYVSAYATMHPWEDWAETWSHYLHMVDTVGTASACGIKIESRDLTAPYSIDRPASRLPSFESLIEQWCPLTYAMNSLNRSLGMPDPYPFTLAPAAVKKLEFVHYVIDTAG